MNVLTAHNLEKSYGKTVAMRGISLEVAAGEVLAVMGPSGSGKSTLLHALAGIELPDRGSVTFSPPGASMEITALSDDERTLLRRKDFGFVFQFSQLVPELNALDNVAVPLLLAGTKKDEAYEVASRWLDVVGLAELADSLPGEMSGGEAQRVAIARALCPEPTVLFADEPTGSLDSLNSELVMTGLTDIVRDRGMTLVLVTHEASIAAYADREVTVRDGRLEA
ncbi:putative ABC transport system ATP-binding protein [Trueperella bonasi]|uniref:ABC transport system ATP-binding protein n=1 Tax=Trueperella bonasi TaxID=312286 RepID=A0ABT9NH97_9ACTO|nr:ABC transporter ATP-binding protein [Trueperella bonasi]MDP9806783.1 putative ABC transport system ATP-binding protein [Trueperella bonasi]